MSFQADAFQTDAFQVAIAGVGDAGAATFALAVELGATVTWSWQTDIISSLSGLETRAASRSKPRQKLAFSTILTDAQHRATLATLAINAVDAPAFLVALPYEDLTVVSSTSSTVTVHTLAYCDWAVAGQRVAVMSPTGVIGEAVVQWMSGSTIGVDADLTAVAVEGARIMPCVGVHLEAEQGISRWQVKLARWDLAARAILNGYGATSTVGVGATVATFDGLPVWDRGVAKREADQPLMSGVELADLGGRISSLPSWTRAAWSRAMRIASHRRAEWQWFKLFLDTVQGRRGAFLLPTGRPDLVPVGDASSGTLTVEAAADYVGAWFPSTAHRRLKLTKTDETFVYREVTACSDAGATQDLALDSAVTGALAKVELLEQVRLERDEVSVTFGSHGFEAGLSARVVQQ